MRFFNKWYGRLRNAVRALRAPEVEGFDAVEVSKKITGSGIAVLNLASQGRPLSDLAKERFGKKTINRGLAELELHSPDILDTYLGFSPPPYKVLVDYNLGFALTQAIRESVGRPHALQLVIRGDTKDPELYDYATKKGYDAIVTADVATRYNDDLCVVAKNHFVPNEAPIVIAIHGKKNGSADMGKRVKHAQKAIQAALANPQDPICHIR